MKRKSLSKKIRFEVFKRDSFKCQYCGASAPMAVLRVDHIEPHSKGGTDEITNLITSCFDCNSGKGAVRISDQSMLEKTKKQLDELQEYRTQLEMMVAWKKSLKDKKQTEADQIAEFWQATCDDRFWLNEVGIRTIASLLKKYSFQEVLDAVEKSTQSYFRHGDDGFVTKESADFAFSKIEAVCAVARREKEDPAIREIFYIRGILSRRFNIVPYRKHQLIGHIRPALPVIGFETLKSVAKHCRSVSDFEETLRISMQLEEGN